MDIRVEDLNKEIEEMNKAGAVKAYSGNKSLMVFPIVENSTENYEHAKPIQVMHLKSISPTDERSDEFSDYADNQMIENDAGQLNGLSITAEVVGINAKTRAFLTGASIIDEDGNVSRVGTGDRNKEVAVVYALTRNDGSIAYIKHYVATVSIASSPDTETESNTQARFYETLTIKTRPTELQVKDKNNISSGLLYTFANVPVGKEVEEIAPYMIDAAKIDKDGKETVVEAGTSDKLGK